ncbi:MAG TPA: chemotaxis protein CheW [Methanoregulaceae archaeon]|nr:chemotaxis protein CheW [Methanoregulaceae archaeon]HQJ87043.1 chemotaxis protein CheW [Methanoregulaceae archaeon]
MVGPSGREEMIARDVQNEAGSTTTGTGVAGETQRGTGGGSVQVVEFLLGREYFAIDLFDVREVVEYTHITHLPSAPEYIRGIIDLRGEITTIIDLKTTLHIADQGERDEKEKRIIVLDPQITGKKIGIMVDDVRSVSTFSRDQVDDAATVNGGNTHIIGIIKKKQAVRGRDETELIIWIDIRQILKEILAGR